MPRIEQEKIDINTTCMSCTSHEVIRDPDPNDWFCDDDVGVVCRKMPNLKRDPDSEYWSDRNEFRSITCSCRPHRVEKETAIPDWCPKKGK